MVYGLSRLLQHKSRVTALLSVGCCCLLGPLAAVATTLPTTVTPGAAAAATLCLDSTDCDDTSVTIQFANLFETAPGVSAPVSGIDPDFASTGYFDFTTTGTDDTQDGAAGTKWVLTGPPCKCPKTL